jgi:hypothetical protein
MKSVSPRMYCVPSTVKYSLLSCTWDLWSLLFLLNIIYMDTTCDLQVEIRLTADDCILFFTIVWITCQLFTLGSKSLSQACSSTYLGLTVSSHLLKHSHISCICADY